MKKTIIFIHFFILMLCLAGCGKKETIVVSELSEVISTSVSFAEQLTQLDVNNIEKRYSLNAKDYDEIIAFVGTASTCDEYVIVKTDAPESMVEKLCKYVDDKKKEYEKYRPDEIYKLDLAVVETYKDSVVMIITADYSNAYEVYEEFLKK